MHDKLLRSIIAKSDVREDWLEPDESKLAQRLKLARQLIKDGRRKRQPSPLRIVIESFWKKVKLGTKSQCWEWSGKKDKDGYGTLKIRRKMFRAHRIAWMFTNGKIPTGCQILHSCDNPPCQNPDHLFCGTNLDNMRDKMTKGRHRTIFGEDHANSKVTQSQVLEMRHRYSTGVSQQRIADDFGITQGHVSAIIRKECWPHI